MSSFTKIAVVTESDGGIGIVHHDEQGNVSAIMLTVVDLEAYMQGLVNAALAASLGVPFKAETADAPRPEPVGIQLDLFDFPNTKH